MADQRRHDLGIEGLEAGRKIGEGGNAVVYAANQPKLDREIAVKILKDTGDDTRRRFGREQRAMGRLSEHAGIVTVYESGYTAHGEPYLMMPLLAGSLDDEIRRRGAIEWREASELLIDVCETVAFAHRQGVIHRDLKPANLMRRDDGRVLVADFGISQITDVSVSIKSTAISFTPAYSPPEALESEPSNPSADVYSLGATFYALLAGRPPFVFAEESPSLLMLINRIVNEPIEPLPERVPAAVRWVIERAMSKQPEDRFQDANAMASALRTAVDAEAAELPGVASVPGDETLEVSDSKRDQLDETGRSAPPTVAQRKDARASRAIEVDLPSPSEDRGRIRRVAGVIAAVVLVAAVLVAAVSIGGGESADLAAGSDTADAERADDEDSVSGDDERSSGDDERSAERGEDDSDSSDTDDSSAAEEDDGESAIPTATPEPTAVTTSASRSASPDPTATPRPDPTATPRPVATSTPQPQTQAPPPPTPTPTPTPLPQCSSNQVRLPDGSCQQKIIVQCSINPSSLDVNDPFTLSANPSTSGIPVTFVFDHGDGSGATSASGYYEKAGTYAPSVAWHSAHQSGIASCGTATVSAPQSSDLSVRPDTSGGGLNGLQLINNGPDTARNIEVSTLFSYDCVGLGAGSVPGSFFVAGLGSGQATPIDISGGLPDGCDNGCTWSISASVVRFDGQDPQGSNDSVTVDRGC